MKYPKLRELKEAIKALIKGPYTSKFPFKPHKPYERFRGRPYFYEKDCLGCTSCVQVCPAKAIDVEDIVREDGKAYRKFTIHWDICICCGQCQANCITTKGIILSHEFNYAVTEKKEQLKQEIEKELVVCDCCGEAIAPYDQYLWVAERLGPLCFSNASLIVFYFNKLQSALNEDKQDLPRTYPETDRREGGSISRSEARSEDDGVVTALRRGRATQPQAEKLTALPTSGFGIGSKQETEFLRSDRIKILCPRCRRQAVLKS